MLPNISFILVFSFSYSDAEILRVLALVNMRAKIDSLPDQLLAAVLPYD